MATWGATAVNEGAKRVLFRGLVASGLLNLLERTSRGVPILAYHGVTAGREEGLRNRRRLHVPAALFDAHMEYLSQHWSPIPFRELLESFAHQRPLPPRSVVVTFDDGYRNVLTVALPLLLRHRVPATLFVMTHEGKEPSWIDRLEAAIEQTQAPSLAWNDAAYPLANPGERVQALEAVAADLDRQPSAREALLDEVLGRLGVRSLAEDDDRHRLGWDDVRRLRDRGLEIGSHAAVHERLTLQSEDQLTASLTASRQTLERELGPQTFVLAYPFGAWNESVCNVARKVGFLAGLTTDPGTNDASVDPFRLRRTLVGADDDLPRLRFALRGLRGWISG
jgi:peptidoglycan/xylan/chitin deacetylase (PgdA/CDA1 family)